MRILFWGTPAFAIPTLRALAEEGHDVVGVVTQPDRPAGRGRTVAMSPVKQVAHEDALPVLQPARADDSAFQRDIAELEPEISVVVAYGQILRSEVLSLPKHGSINVHASLLPQLRGAAPVHWAILRGLDVTGISIMRMDEGLDSGPVLFQVEEPIRADESAGELGMRLSQIGAEAMVEILAMLDTGLVPDEHAQNHEQATYAPKIDRSTAKIDWSQPAVEVARWIRGMDPRPGAWSTLENSSIKLFRPRIEIHSGTPGEVLDVDPEVGALIAAGEDAVRIREVQPAGKRRMAAAEWIRGRGVSAGQYFA